MPSPRRFTPSLLLLCSSMLLSASVAAQAPAYDLIIRGGTLYDGSGQPPVIGDVAIKNDRIVAVGKVTGSAKSEVQAKGMAVAPGFINMLSWATESLIVDPKSQSDIRQGVTLEVMGEGWSMGPLNPAMKRQETERQGDLKFPIEWTSLGDYLSYLEKRGVSTNVASFVGAATVRVHELGEGDVDPTPEQLTRMRALVRQAMNEGAMGVGSSLIYAPGSYAETDELVALTSEAAQMRRHVYQPYALRRRPAGGSRRRAHRNFAPFGRARRNLSPQDGGAQQLGQTRLGRRQDRGRARRRPADHHRYVHLYRGRHRARRGDADLGAGGRA